MKSFSVLFFICLFISCKTKKDMVPIVEKQKPHIAYPQAEIGVFSKQNDPYKLTDIKLNLNYLELDITYAGGCKEHDFKLIGSPEIKNGVREVQLVHISKGDDCKALIKQKLIFSISNLAQNYEPKNQIKLKFENYATEITYSYQ